MGLLTSDKFASTIAVGTDWREVAKSVLEQLTAARTDGDGFNIGFIYVSDVLAEDAESIVNLFRSVLGIEDWVGCVGLGVCGCGQGYVDEPALSAMIGRIPEGSFKVFPATLPDMAAAQDCLSSWLENTDTILTLVHGDPLCDDDPVGVIEGLSRLTGCFLAGGMVSSRTDHLHFSDVVTAGGVSGVVFSQNVPVATSLSQGCAPIGPVRTITRCEEQIVMELDGRPAFDVFSEDLRTMASSRTGREDHVVEINAETDDTEEGGDLFRGEVHVAFPVSGTDRQDYLVRNAMGIDPEKGWIAVAHNISNGDRMMFVHRDDNTVQADLARSLLDLRERIIKERGDFKPQGALYVSCVARTVSDFGDGPGGEMALVREIIGDVPLTGFYANGEISNCRLYGYSSVLILFF